MQTLEVGEPIRLTGAFADFDGVPTDPTTITLTIDLPDGSQLVVPQVSLTNSSVGVYFYDYVPSLVGGYAYRFDGTGTIQQGETDYFVVVATGAHGFDSGPCQPWTTAAEVRLCCSSLGVSGTDDYVDDFTIMAAIDLASDLLYRLTAQQYPGLCSETVRPSSSRGTLGAYAPGWSGITSHDVPLVDESALNPRDVTFSQIPKVDLVAWWPVTAVTEVLVDGSAVDPTTYRVDEWRYLTRLAGVGPNYTNEGWPRDQHMDRPSTETGTFEVTFLHGMAVPPAGVRAASILACQLLKAYLGQQCQLPPRTTSVQRQGVSISLIDPSMVEKGLTGVWECDLFIRSVNPKGYTGGSAVWSPDVTPPPRRVG